MSAMVVAERMRNAKAWFAMRRWHTAAKRLVASFLRPHAAHDLQPGDVTHVVALLRRGGCPICRGVAEALTRWAFWFLYEGYGEGAWMSRLCASGGFCPSHFWALARLGRAWSLSYVAQYLSADLLRRVQAARRRAWHVAWQRPDACPGCVEIVWWEQQLVGKLVAAQYLPAVQAALAAADGLCPRHLRQVVAQGGGSTLRCGSRDATTALEEQGGRSCLSP
jgi:hypothetical protein